MDSCLAVIAAVVISFLILCGIAGLGVWLIPIATAGAVVVGFWQAFAGAVVLGLIGTLISKR